MWVWKQSKLNARGKNSESGYNPLSKHMYVMISFEFWWWLHETHSSFTLNFIENMFLGLCFLGWASLPQFFKTTWNIFLCLRFYAIYNLFVVAHYHKKLTHYYTFKRNVISKLYMHGVSECPIYVTLLIWRLKYEHSLIHEASSNKTFIGLMENINV